MEFLHQIFLGVPRLIADAINGGRFLSILHERNALYFFRRKNMHRIRHGDIRPPRFAGIVISMDNENLDAALGCAVQFSAKSHLRRQAMMV